MKNEKNRPRNARSPERSGGDFPFIHIFSFINDAVRIE